MKMTGAQIGSALSYLAAVEPEVLATYQIVRAIWLAVNGPTKTEADFVAQLVQASSQLVTDSDAILLANGYRQDPQTGAWAKASA